MSNKKRNLLGGERRWPKNPALRSLERSFLSLYLIRPMIMEFLESDHANLHCSLHREDPSELARSGEKQPREVPQLIGNFENVGKGRGKDDQVNTLLAADLQKHLQERMRWCTPCKQFLESAKPNLRICSVLHVQAPDFHHLRQALLTVLWERGGERERRSGRKKGQIRTKMTILRLLVSGMGLGSSVRSFTMVTGIENENVDPWF